MDILQHNWIIWFYIIVLLPFQIYDVYKKEDRGYKDYIILIICSCFALAAGIETLISDKHIIMNSPGLYLILIIAYLQSIIDAFTLKGKRHVLFCGIFTIFILLIIITNGVMVFLP